MGVCGFCNVWTCVCERVCGVGECVCVCVCVCVGVCVFVWAWVCEYVCMCVGFVMCGCFGNIYTVP